MKEFVYIVDDDEAVRDSLKWLLEGNGYSVKVFENAEQLLDTQTEQETSLAGCLILDVRMPGITGIELYDELLTKKISIPVIFITGHGSVTLAVKSMKKGAIDFLEKPFSEEEICKLVDSALKKDRESNDKKESNLKAQCLLARLTPRENQVLERITAGRLNKQIADDLNISIKTVEAHRANIMTKVEARTVAELIKIALTATEPAQAS